MSIAVFPGSFDPPTYGHLNIIERASKLFETVDVVVAVNPKKNYLFTAKERVAMIQNLSTPWHNVTVHLCDTLIVDYAKKIGANVLLRGIRNMNDFAYEFDLSLLNHNLNADIETLFIPTEPKFVIIKSSAIKELASFGGDVSNMVPPLVEQAMKEKYAKMTFFQKM